MDHTELGCVLNLMRVSLEEKSMHRGTGKRTMEMEVEIAVMCPQAKTLQGFVTTARSEERGTRHFLPKSPQKTLAMPTP